MSTEPSSTPLALWRLTREELLAARPLWPHCATCAERTDLDAYCPHCDGTVELASLESGDLLAWGRYAGLSLADLDWQWLGPRVSTAIQLFAQTLPDRLHAGDGLILVGGAGCGKTHIAVGMGLLALGCGFRVYATTLSDLFLDIRATFAGDARAEARLMERLRSVDLLILDDVGLETPSAWAVDRLGHLVNARYSRVRSTLLTTHLHPARLEQVWGERVASRLYETCQVVSLADVADYRPVLRARLDPAPDDRWPGTAAAVVVKEAAGSRQQTAIRATDKFES